LLFGRLATISLNLSAQASNSRVNFAPEARMTEKKFQPSKFPFHSLIVHVPVGTWTFALVFDVLSRFHVGGNGMVRLSFFAIAFGLAAALAAIPTGVLDWGGVKKEKPAWKIGLYHMAANLTVTILFAINLGVRLSNWKTAEMVSALAILLSAVGVLLLFVGAYLGGRMIYDYGVGVARGSKEKWRRIAERGGARVPEKKED
jgi:uncharacterized membrane protein